MFSTPNPKEKREVRMGAGRAALPVPMTHAQARRYGDRCMPADLRRVGFATQVFVSDPEINGGTFFRISYGKSVPSGKSAQQ